MQARTRSKLEKFAIAEQLPAHYPTMAEQWFVPLAQYLFSQWQVGDGAVLLVGINGAQGTGKTTLCAVLELLLRELGASSLTLSIDDYYLTRSRRESLAQQVHPLLQTRGVPGTHELPLLNQVIDELLAGRGCPAPRFDKSRDDRVDEDQWQQLDACNIVLLEGWCVGCPPQPAEALLQPENTLELEEDRDGKWRRYVNARLDQDYAALFARLDCLVMLQAPSTSVVLEWRSLQEQKLAGAGPGEGVMGASALWRFVQHYERLTRHCLESLPARADYLLRLDQDHRIAAAGAT